MPRSASRLILKCLRGRVVDLEDLERACERRVSEREAVQAGADDHVLGDAFCDRLGERVLGVAGAQDHGPVAGVGA
jgi:hypothetical protein